MLLLTISFPIDVLISYTATTTHPLMTEYDQGILKLHDAVKANDVRAVQRHLRAGVDVDVMVDGEASLHVACRLGLVGVVEALLKAGADVYASTRYRQETPLYLASMEGHLTVVELVMRMVPGLSERERTGALLAASRYGHSKIVQFLVDHGHISDLDALWGNGQTALIMAAQQGYGTIMRILLKADCSVDHLDKNGLSALATAVLHQHSELIPILLDAGANLNSSLSSPLHTACSNGDLHSVKELLKSTQCDVNAAHDQDGRTALYTVAELGFIHIVEELLKFGANPNIPTMDTGNTAIFTAMDMPLISMYICPEKSATRIVHALLQGGADPSHINNACLTPLHIAVDRKLPAVARILLGAECALTADWWYMDFDNTYSFGSGNLEVIGMLTQELRNPRFTEEAVQTVFPHLAGLSLSICRDHRPAATAFLHKELPTLSGH